MIMLEQTPREIDVATVLEGLVQNKSEYDVVLYDKVPVVADGGVTVGEAKPYMKEDVGVDTPDVVATFRSHRPTVVMLWMAMPRAIKLVPRP